MKIDKRAVSALYKNGKTVLQISKKMRCTAASVYEALKTEGVDLRRKYPNKKAIEAAIRKSKLKWWRLKNGKTAQINKICKLFSKIVLMIRDLKSEEECQKRSKR
jgi:hypothetical protein